MASVPTSLLYKIDDIELDVGKGHLRRGSQEIHLKPKAFQILVYLVAERDRLVSKEELLEQFWKDTVVGEDVLANSIGEIRRALGDTSRDSQYLKTVPKRGYRFVADVQEVSSEALIATEQITTVQVREEYSDERPSRRYSRWVASIVLASAAALVGWHYWPKPLPTSAETGIRTAIVQFENRSSRGDIDWLRSGLVDMLATSLSASPRIALIPPHQLEHRLRLSSNSPLAYEDALRGAREAGARAMIMGVFASLGDSIRLDIHIYDVPSGRLMGGETLTVRKPELLLTQLDSLSSKLAARLGAPLLTQTRLAEVMTNNLEAYRLYSLGLARTRDLRDLEAIDLYQKAVESDPGFAMTYARIGYTYTIRLANPTEGKRFLEKAYHLADRLTPRDRLLIRAWYAIACQDYEGAQRAYRDIFAVFPLEMDAYYDLGFLLISYHRYDEARQVFERGLALEPDMPQLHNALATAYLGLGEKEKALSSAQRYVTLTDEPNAYDTLANLYQTLGRYDEAHATYLEAIRRKPDFGIAIIHLGNLYFQKGRYREALEQYREYGRSDSSDTTRARSHARSAWVYWKKGDLGSAEGEMAEAVRLHKPEEILERLLLEADRGRLTLTGDLRRQLLGPSTLAGRGFRGGLRMPYFIAGYIALRDHKTDEALENLREALKQDPMYWFIDPLESCLADAYLELGRFDEAIAEYRRILRFNENYAMARYRLGLALEHKGLSREARAEFERFLAIWKNADPDIPELIDARQRYEQGSALSAVKR